MVDGDEGWAVNEETELEFVGVEGDFRWCYQPGSEAAKAAEARRPAKRVQTGELQCADFVIRHLPITAMAAPCARLMHGLSVELRGVAACMHACRL